MKAASPGWPTCWTPETGAVGRGSGCKPNPTHGRMGEHPGRAANPVSTNHGASTWRVGATRTGVGSARIPHMTSDPAAGIGVLTALAAGIISFLSPCVLPLVPGYLSAVTGGGGGGPGEGALGAGR